MESLWRVCQSIKQAADSIGVNIVTGDTKVVDRGKGDGIYINTTGLGQKTGTMEPGPTRINQADVVLVSGDIGRHGITVMASREGLEFETDIVSDCGPVSPMVERLLEEGIELHCLRDLTRGGLATAIYEICGQAGATVVLDEKAIPIQPAVKGACEILGLDPLYVANEGCFAAFVAPDHADRALEIIRAFENGKAATAIGEVTSCEESSLLLKTSIGTHRLLTMLSGEQLPRIC